MYRIELRYFSYDILEHTVTWTFLKKDNAQKLWDAIIIKHPNANKVIDNTYIPIVLSMVKLETEDNEIDNIISSLSK